MFKYYKSTIFILTLSFLPITISSCQANNTYSTTIVHTETKDQIKQNSNSSWRLMTEAEEKETWNYILNNPLAIAALNQLAIEGFIGYNCPKTFYLNEEFGGFQTLLRVKCSTPQGVSIAIGYDEIRVIFNRFEDNIESFEIERISYSEKPPKFDLPDEF